MQGHSYVVTAWATDNALPAPGNIRTPVSNFFTFDSSAPAVCPIGLQSGAFYANIASITGTAQDYPLSPLSCAGVKQIQVLIMRHSDNAYWLGGGSWGVMPSTWPIVIPTGNKTGVVSFNYTDLPQWISGQTYDINLNATNNINVVSSSLTYTISIDTIAPVAVVTRPAEGVGYSLVNPLNTISGTAMDYSTGGSYAFAGVPSNGVKISVRLDEPPLDATSDLSSVSSSDQWWNFNTSTWVAYNAYGTPTQTESATMGTAVVYGADYPASPVVSWYIQAPSWVSGQTYRIRVVANDNVIPTPNYETPYSTRSCTVDIIPPWSGVVMPAANGQYNGSTNALIAISGTANDDIANSVQYTNIRIAYQNAGSTFYWNGTGWQLNVSTWITTQNLTAGGTWWYYNFGSASNWVSGQTYSMNSSAVSTAQNVETNFSTTTFQIDTQPPQQGLTFRKEV